MVRSIVVVLCCVVLCCVVLGCVGLGSHFVYSVRGKGYATVECWGGHKWPLLSTKKTKTVQGGGLASVRVGGAVDSYQAPGTEILKEPG